MLLRKLVSLAVPAATALAAFLHAHAIGALVGATAMPESIAPFAEARAAAAATAAAPRGERSADALLDRNPFDHVTGSLRALAVGDEENPSGDESPFDAPPCDGVRTVIAVRDADPEASFAVLDVRGKRFLRKRGRDVDDVRVVFVGEDRVWLARGRTLCQARMFGVPPATATAAPPVPARSDAELKVQQTGPNEYQVDRGSLDRLLEAQTELMKTPLVPEKEGDRLVGYRIVRLRPGSALAALGLAGGDVLVSINGIEVTSLDKIMEAHARLRAGTLDRLTLHVLRGGKPTNLDYVIR